MVYTYNRIFSFKKEWNSALCYNMDDSWRHAKWNEPDTKRHISFIRATDNSQILANKIVVTKGWVSLEEGVTV